MAFRKVLLEYMAAAADRRAELARRRVRRFRNQEMSDIMVELGDVTVGEVEALVGGGGGYRYRLFERCKAMMEKESKGKASTCFEILQLPHFVG